MTSPPSTELQARELAFFGAVTASLSHQINNVLTIINELGGLLTDVAGAAGAGGASRERLEHVAERILDNVARGSEYIRVLNRFSHAADRAVADVDVGEQVLLLASATRRFAELRQARLEVVVPQDTVLLRGSAFRLLHLLFVCIEGVLAVAGVGVVRVVARREGGRVVVRVAGDADYAAAARDHEARLELIADACRPLGGTPSFARGPAGFAFEVAIDVHVTEGEGGECT